MLFAFVLCPCLFVFFLYELRVVYSNNRRAFCVVVLSYVVGCFALLSLWMVYCLGPFYSRNGVCIGFACVYFLGIGRWLLPGCVWLCKLLFLFVCLYCVILFCCVCCCCCVGSCVDVV